MLALAASESAKIDVTVILAGFITFLGVVMTVLGGIAVARINTVHRLTSSTNHEVQTGNGTTIGKAVEQLKVGQVLHDADDERRFRRVFEHVGIPPDEATSTQRIAREALMLDHQIDPKEALGG